MIRFYPGVDAVLVTCLVYVVSATNFVPIADNHKVQCGRNVMGVPPRTQTWPACYTARDRSGTRKTGIEG